MTVLKVAFVPHGYMPSIGGAQAYTRGLAEGLARLGHEVHVVVPDLADPEGFYDLDHSSVGVGLEAIGGVAVTRVPYGANARRLMATPRRRTRVLRRARRRYAGHLAAALDTIQPHAVVTLPHLFPNVEEVMALRPLSAWKVVYAPLLHENDPYWPTERIGVVVMASDAVIALTHHEKERLISAYGATPDRLRVIPPGVDSPPHAKNGGGPPTVLFLGRRTPSKRLETVYSAMELVWPSRPDARLVVAGPSPTATADPADWMRVDPRVTVIDHLDDDHRAQVLDAAAVVVSASLVESFGITILEAWAHGRPVVVADTPVNRSVVRDGVDGLVGGTEPPELASAISRLLSDRELAQRLGDEGRQRTVTEFTWDRSAAALEVLLTTTVS